MAESSSALTEGEESDVESRGVALNLGKSQRSPVAREMASKSPVYVTVSIFTIFIVLSEALSENSMLCMEILL